MYLGWYDPDKKKPARQKLAEAVERYVEKFGDAPELCLTSPADKADLDAPSRQFPEPPALPVEAVAYIPRWTFYVGSPDVAVAQLAA